MITGGFADVYECTEDIIILANDMKEEVENTLGEIFKVFEPILYTTQVVAGTNYNIKVHVGEEKFIHIKIYVPLPVYNAPNELLECESNKTLFDSLN